MALFEAGGVVPEGGQSHPGNILAVQVGCASVIAGSPHLLVLQDRDSVVTDDGLHMSLRLRFTSSVMPNREASRESVQAGPQSTGCTDRLTVKHGQHSKQTFALAGAQS